MKEELKTWERIGSDAEKWEELSKEKKKKVK